MTDYKNDLDSTSWVWGAPKLKGRSSRRYQSCKSRQRRQCSLVDAVEALERRSMMTANVLDVANVLWNGKTVDAVKDEYVLRMPQTNVATAQSVVDYQCKTPVVQAGWSMQTLGSGFFKLTAPGATQAAITNWATRNGAQSVNVNAVRTFSKTPNDPLYGDTANWAFPQISADNAWETGTGTSTTIVAVLDTGVDYAHPDLAGNMWKNPNETPGDGIDNDTNGYVDDVYGINAVTGTGNPMDDFGHGTMCAGLIGAVGDNAVGIAGVNWSVQIMAVKIGDANGNFSLAAEVAGIQYVVNQKVAGQNIAAANCSYGGYSFVQQEFDALNQLAQTGVTIVASAGNASNNNDANPHYPSNYTIPGLIAVAASDQADNLANFSNYGRTSVDLAAPGVGILSTRSSQSTAVFTPYKGDNKYTVNSGTSFAAPLVAGTAGLLKSLKISASPEQVKSAILSGVDKVAGLSGKVLTGGRLNVKNAVDLILSTQGATPVASFTTGQNLSFLEGNAGYSYADIKLSLDRPCDPGKSCSVWYETRLGGSAISDVDFVSQSGYLTFSGSEMEKSFRIKIVGDRLPETAEQFAIRLDATKSKGVTIGTTQANVIILDDDNTTAPIQPAPTNAGLVPQVGIALKKDGSGNALPVKEGGLATLVVSLDKTSNKVVSVKYRTNQPVLVPATTALEGLDYTATSGTLTFNPGERSKEFTIKILADKIADDKETFDVVLFDPINADLAGAAAGTIGRPGTTATITDVPYSPPSQPGFQITLSFPDSSLTTSQQRVFQNAAARWQEIIVGDLPNVVDPASGQSVDDILIAATAPAIDGAGGILGGARPTDFRSGAKGLPWKGEMQFDSADVASLEQDGTLTSVILHEMGHALGFGALWQQFGLVSGVGGTNPIYVGANALREYNSIFATAGTSVPVENTGGQGTAGAHWRETVFKTELMTGYAEPAGAAMPLSRITVGAMADLGYTVNYVKADPYLKPASVLKTTQQNGAVALPAARQFVFASSPTPTADPPRGMPFGTALAASANPTSFRQLSRAVQRSAFATLARE
ncbi:MAG: S8 family serine peptidase [Planctomycetota bacterium]